jgi:hypothetical protein
VTKGEPLRLSDNALISFGFCDLTVGPCALSNHRNGTGAPFPLSDTLPPAIGQAFTAHPSTPAKKEWGVPSEALLEWNVSARIIHERFCCNHGFAAATSLHAACGRAGGRARRSPPRRTVSSTPRVLPASRARLATRLRDFATNRHEQCGLSASLHADSYLRFLQTKGLQNLPSSTKSHSLGGNLCQQQ